MEGMNNTNYSARVIHGTYYAHIDGIRALAVLPVMLFHILASLCPGGFAGVDVFFVISGYLITGGILRDIGNDRFTIMEFYHRRILRIMPAYFILIASVFILGCAIYYSTLLIHLGDASVMGTLFSANLYFWKSGSDYFAPSIHNNPLLHLWSLSVEEQFYLFIPLLCSMTWKFRRHLVAPMLAFLATLSLVAAIYAVMSGKQNSAFYLLHYRAWELLAGSLLAMLPPITHRAGETKHTLLATTGLLMVLVPYATISSSTPFPGPVVLPTVIGTAALIRYGQSGWVSKVLSSRPLTLTGKLSYSLYLWHWPVTVFWKYAVYDKLYLYDYIGMFFLSMLLGFLSWKFVELPMRTMPYWTMRRSFGFAASGIALLVTLGTVCVFSRGWPTLFHPFANSLINDRPRFVESLVRNKIRHIKLALGYDLPPDDFLSFKLGGIGNYHLGNSGEPEIFLIGDSHAGALQYGLDSALRDKNHSGFVISRGATRLYDLQVNDCQYALSELAKHPNAIKVLLVQRWDNYDTPDTYTSLEKYALHVASLGKRLYIATSVPTRKQSPSDIAARLRIIPPRRMESDWHDGTQADSTYDQVEGEINHKLEGICERTGAILVPLHLSLKHGNQYLAFEEMNGKTISLYSDSHHLSPEGSLRAARFLMPYLFPDSIKQVRPRPGAAASKAQGGVPLPFISASSNKGSP